MQKSNKIEIKPGVELKFRYGMAAPDNRPGFKGYHQGDVRVLSVRGQNVDLEQKQAGEWRNDGLVSSIPYLQHMQNEYEKEMGTKSKLSETKKTMKLSELRQIIREEIQKEIFGLEKHGRGDDQLQRKYEKEAETKSKQGYVVHVNRTKTGFKLSDWFDDELTVASYQNGNKIS